MNVIDNIMINGFAALAAYAGVFAMIILVLFCICTIINAFIRTKIAVDGIVKLFTTTMIFVLVFSLLDYFLIP